MIRIYFSEWSNFSENKKLLNTVYGDYFPSLAKAIQGLKSFNLKNLTKVYNLVLAPTKTGVTEIAEIVRILYHA